MIPPPACVLSPCSNVSLTLPSVASYSTLSATLVLEHSFPAQANVSALVDVRLLLETLKGEQTRVGEWVNVLGYVDPEPAEGARRVDRGGTMKVSVQALMLWSAGPLDIKRYETCMAAEENQSEDGASSSTKPRR